MNNHFTITAQSRPRLFDLALVVIGPTVLATVFGLELGSLRLAILGFVAGCALAALASRWPRLAGPLLLVLSIPGMAVALFLTIYTRGMPYTLFMLWGSTAFLTGGVGVLRRRSVARQPRMHFLEQAAVVSLLAAIFLLYFLIMWPPRGKAILLSLPIMDQAVEHVQAQAGGIWAAYWTTPRVTIPEALERVKGSLGSGAWTIVDTAFDPAGGVSLVSAQRGAYSLMVMYDPGNPSPYWSTGDYTGAYMTAQIRRAQAVHFPEFGPKPPAPP